MEITINFRVIDHPPHFQPKDPLTGLIQSGQDLGFSRLIVAALFFSFLLPASHGPPQLLTELPSQPPLSLSPLVPVAPLSTAGVVWLATAVAAVELSYCPCCRAILFLSPSQHRRHHSPLPPLLSSPSPPASVVVATFSHAWLRVQTG